MDDEGETEYISEPLILDTEDRLTAELTPRNENGRESTASDSELSQLLKKLELRSALPVTSMSSFMAAVSIIDPPFKLRTRHRPWSISAGQGAHGSVEVHRYVPGRNFNVFNDSSPLKLVAYNPYPKRTGEYYAVKRLLPHDEEKTPTSRGPNRFALLANELRILAHGDLRGHPNIVFLFGVSHMPPRSGPNLAEPNLVLQEGDCGDLFSFYRESDLGFNRQKLVEIKMSLLFDITCGLAALHRHGVVHCDLKPQNILIRRRNGRDTDIHPVKSEMEAGQVAIEALIGQSTFVAILADFGGSLIVSDHTGNTVRPDVWTPLWGAPELYTSTPISKDLLPRTDIYSAGLIFAFILLEGRDIFTKVIHRGRMHQYDVTMSKDDVCAQKVSGEALGLAKAAVADFQVMLFDVTADGNRIYESMNTMYHPAQVGIFNNILELALQLDPSRRVRDATDLIGPWAQALQENSHVRNYVHYPQQGTFNSYYSGKAGGRDYFRKPRVCARYAG
jgi:serine/threonine protein kinase